MRLKKRVLITTAVLAVAVIAGFGLWSIAQVSAESESYENLKLFTEVLTSIKNNYVEDVEPKKLVNDAISGMLRSLDPHSAFLLPEDYKEMQVSTKGEFGGLGIQISIKDGMLTVISPIEDTPAWEAGILAGDIIFKIDNEGTKDLTLDEAVKKLRGPKGTPVKLSIIREGDKEPREFTIVRDIIQVKSVKHKVLADDIGYIKVSQFQTRTAQDLGSALSDLESKNITSLVLDLRNNPGGLLTSAVDTAGYFLPRGQLVVYTKNRNGDKTEYRTRDESGFNKPMAVLINQGSASASEIVAGALKDWKRAVSIGTKTFGKGSVQSIIPLSEGAGLRLTTSKYYTPKGTSIQNTGISPDIEVKLKPANGIKEHVVVREADLEGRLENEQNNGERGVGEPEKAVLAAETEEEDTQLQRAIDLLKTWTVFRELPQGEDVKPNP